MFYPVALKILRDTCTGAKKLATGTLYYFVKGALIGDDGYIYASSRIEDAIFNPTDSGRGVELSFSAIVGANGSGKSTLVELMIRMCNNFAASVFGEYSAVQNHPHPHFIDGIYAELYYRLDKAGEAEFYRLSIQGRNVELVRFSWAYDKFIRDVEPIYDNEESIDPDLSTVVPLDSYKPFPHQWPIEKVLGAFFYTYVSNYSTYAYNPADFSKERTPVNYERRCRRLGSVNPKLEVCHWLEGVFHRNELYQEPLVLYPNRIKGNLDVNIENRLAYSRFMAVLINKDSRFKVINQHIEATSLKVTAEPAVEYDDRYLRNKANYKYSSNGYKELKKAVVEIWGDCLGENLKVKAGERHYGSKALDYLVYKTLKISSAYPKLRSYFFNEYRNSRSRFDREITKKYIERLVKEPSHVTRKLRQTIIYLIYGLYDFDRDQMDFPLDTLTEVCARIKEELKEKVNTNPKLRILTVNGMEDLTPPPFFQTQVMLEDTFTNEKIEFNTLSSGERQIIYNVTGILYQLLNIDSIVPGGEDRLVGYANINVILEEIEQYFHPDMQRRLVKFLMDSIRQCTFQHIKAVNVMLVTHSPFVLSDIPARNVLAITKDGKPLGETEVIKSFGANIHDLLHHPFFLKDGAVGEFANDYIIKLGKDIANIGSEGKNVQLKDTSELESLISIVDEPILKRILWEELNRRTDSEEAKRRWIDEQIQNLQRMKDSLDNKQQ